MAICAAPAKSERELIPQGTHIGVCADVILKKNCQTRYGERDRLEFRFQLPFCCDSNGRPQMAFFSCNSSCAKEASLWKMIEPWIGVVPLCERPKFDLEKLMGRPVSLVIAHTPGQDGRIWADVKFMMPADPEHEGLEIQDYVREVRPSAAPADGNVSRYN